MAKTKDPQLTQWDEERDRVNYLAARARKMKLVVPVLPKETTDNQEEEEEDEVPFVDNGFCPTGKGGGVDPSCGKGGSVPDASKQTYYVSWTPHQHNPVVAVSIKSEEESLKLSTGATPLNVQVITEKAMTYKEMQSFLDELADREFSRKEITSILHGEGVDVKKITTNSPPPEVPWYALLGNAFCPTGKGGGVDPTCGPGGSRRTTKHGETLYEATRDGSGTWRLANGTPTPDHIQNMKPPIPPTWNEVHVNLDPKATLFAQGTDKKGRVQPRYSDSHNAKAAAGKWGRVSELRKKREGIYKEIEQDAKDPRLKENAECLRVVMKTGIRPGGGSDTGADFESFGATSLQGKHVRVDADGNVSLAFVAGKSKGKEKVYPINDSKTAKLLARRAKKAGPDGNLFDTSPGSLRNYSKSKDGGGFKTKDHRTALGTETAISEIRRIGSNKRFASMKEYKAAVKEVATKVANTLGNTPNVALKSYISPEVFAGWRPPKGK